MRAGSMADQKYQASLPCEKPEIDGGRKVPQTKPVCGVFELINERGISYHNCHSYNVI